MLLIVVNICEKGNKKNDSKRDTVTSLPEKYTTHYEGKKIIPKRKESKTKKVTGNRHKSDRKSPQKSVLRLRESSFIGQYFLKKKRKRFL